MHGTPRCDGAHGMEGLHGIPGVPVMRQAHRTDRMRGMPGIHGMGGMPGVSGTLRRCPRRTGGVRDTRDAQEVSGMHRRCPVCGCPARPRASVARAVAVPLTFTNQLSPSAHPLPSLAVLSPWRLRNLCSLVNGISANETPTPPSLPLPAPGEILASHLHPHPLLPLGIKGTSPC